MPKGKVNVSRRKQHRNRNIIRRRRQRTSKVSNLSSTVHRRLVLYPNVTDAEWLSKLAWYASVALKLFKLAIGVSDDLMVETATVGSGSVILLGPGDFASLSPMAVPIVTTSSDNEVKMLKAFPFERAALTRVGVRISPSVDLGSRGGMYAAVVLPVDANDSALLFDIDSKKRHLIDRYSCSYDDIIKHPKAKMAPVTKAISFNINLNGTAHNIRVIWNDNLGYVNAYPNCVIIVAFSDMASKKAAVDSNYGPNKSLFEIHMTGSLSLQDPGDLSSVHEVTSSDASQYTPMVFSTGRANTNGGGKLPCEVAFFEHRFTTYGPLDLRTIPVEIAEGMLRHYGRSDLLPKLRIERGLQDMEMK